MALSLILTVNNRTPEVSKQVADSLKCAGNHPDELIVVIDRATDEARKGAVAAYAAVEGQFPVRFVYLDGEPGWKGPAAAWNAGFQAATGDLFYCISSETVQDAGNVEKARKICGKMDTAVFGACHNSEKTDLVVGAEPGLLVSSKMPRPLGFITCFPAKNCLDIGGFDENFMKGYWYDDDDFFLRMWRTGLDFVFDDSIHGTHLDHERPDLATPDGQAGIRVNEMYMLRKHGTAQPWSNLLRTEKRSEGKTVWGHV